MTSRQRKALLNVVRVVICGAALWFVAREVTLDDRVTLRSGETLSGAVEEHADYLTVHFEDGLDRNLSRDELAVDEQGGTAVMYGLRSTWRKSRGSVLLLALLAQFPVVFVLALRLKLLLKAQRIALSYWDCIKLSFAGNFLNFATPLGSNAGDVFKAYFLTTHTDRKTEAAATIFLDRLVGLATMLLAVSLIMMFSAGVRGLDELRPYVLTMLVVGVGGVLLYRSKTLRRHLVPWGMLQRLSFFDHLRRIDQSARELVSRKGIVVAAVFLSLLLQIVAMTGYFAAAVALGLTAHAGNILDYFVCFYTGSVVQALPGPPQGLGTVELVYRFLLADFGSASQIVSVAVAIRVTVLTAALPGLWVMLTGSYRPRASAAELVGSPAVGAATDPDRTPVVR